MAPPRSRPGLDHLAPRQREALALLARGASVRETARAMGVSPETVKTHRRAVYRRLGVAGRVGALIRLYEARLAAAAPGAAGGDSRAGGGRPD